jgi:hypothetical protein
MAHESIVWGFIEGASIRNPKLQKINKGIIARLPEFDEFPPVARSMFSYPRKAQLQGNFRAQVIHFGGSVNHLCFHKIFLWLKKFEDVLSRLYWGEAIAHIWTDYIDGCYQFYWTMSSVILETYHEGKPKPTSLWTRHDLRLERHLNSPPTISTRPMFTEAEIIKK